MRTKVQKWGNSLAIRIPKGFAKELRVSQDSEVELILDEEGLVVRPARKEYTLSDLLAKVSKDNVHGEVPTGNSVGREVW